MSKMNNDEELGKLFEELSIDRTSMPALSPTFQGYGKNPMIWAWYGRPWIVRGNSKDIVYLDKNGKRHRIYGPAYISQKYDIEEWWKEGLRHREGGPAYRHKNNMVWFYEGKLHRLDGPAVIEYGGPKQYWIDGIMYSAKQYKWEIARRKRKGLIK